MELQRVAGASAYVTFPMLSNTGVPQTGLTVTGDWIAWEDKLGPDAAGNPGFRGLSGSIREIGSSGVYTNALASTELPAASPWVMLRYQSAGISTQYLLVRTATYFTNVQAFTAGAITTAAFTAGAIDAAAIAANAIGASELATDAVDEIVDAVWDEVILSAHTTDNTTGKAINRLYFATVYLDAAVSSRSAPATGQTVSVVDTGAITTASFAAGAIDAAAIAANAIGASELATDAVTEITNAIVPLGSGFADDILGRTLTRGASGGRNVQQALQALRNKVTISAGTLTVYSNNDSTAEWTATVATEAVTAIVTSIDPA